LTSVNQNYPNTSKNNLKQKKEKRKPGSGVFISMFQLYLLKNSGL
jgi:hypothetical protein